MDFTHGISSHLHSISRISRRSLNRDSSMPTRRIVIDYTTTVVKRVYCSTFLHFSMISFLCNFFFYSARESIFLLGCYWVFRATWFAHCEKAITTFCI